MPTYAYACKQCGHRFETVQSFADPTLTECPQCAGPLRKEYGTIGVTFNGSGFYRTDSRAGAKKPGSGESGSGSGSGDSGSGSGDSGSGDSGSSSRGSGSDSTSGSSSSSGSKTAKKDASGSSSASPSTATRGS